MDERGWWSVLLGREVIGGVEVKGGTVWKRKRKGVENRERERRGGG